ncbi:hypothetical protein [Peterkaempfera griseoplana]|uniref:hypothetical protein n=1 Tax=Peterkaempfera griseoplana TaxID=66896 RepID=UPI0006E1924D|nr:hypothetical protein [Peterkaempfera griseoplana]
MVQHWSRVWPQRVFADPVEVELAAVGLARIVSDGMPQARRRSRKHLDGWLSGFATEGRDAAMRLLAEVLACQAAHAVLDACGGDTATAKAQLGQAAADASDAARLAGIPCPARPTGLALTWLWVEAIEATGAQVPPVLLDAESAEWFAGRWDRFVGTRDTGRAHELLLTLAGIMVAALGRLLDAKPARVAARLDEWAAEVFRRGGGTAWGVPDDPRGLSPAPDGPQ